jgi:hypothetical protein
MKIRNMLNIPTYEQFLLEGGWATDKTQGTVITPDVIAEVVELMKDLSSKFNSHLESEALPSLDFSQPIGSGTWWDDDLQTQPNKTYGDIDFMVAYPTLKITNKGNRADEISTVKLYNNQLLNWLDSVNLKWIDAKETRAISTADSIKLLIVLSGDRYIQVDLVVTHNEYKEWAIFRFTPERNVKGFVLGKMYTAFGNLLELSIQPRGVRAKFVGEILAPYSRRVGTVEKLISLSAENFMHDITKFFWEQSGTDKPYQPSTTFQQWKGIDKHNPTFTDLCAGIKGVADTLDQLGEFGAILKYKSSSEFLQSLVKEYERVMMETANSTKFAKAKTPAAFAAVEKIKSLIDKYIKLAKDNLS